MTVATKVGIRAACLLFAIEGAVGTSLYVEALATVRERSSRQVARLTGDVFFFAPLRVVEGTALRHEEIARYLKHLGYVEAASGEPASFYRAGTTVSIHPRSDDFSPVRVAIGDGRVSEVYEHDRRVKEARLEPGIISNSVRTAQGVEPHVIRFPIHPDELRRSLRMLRDAVLATEDKRFYAHQGVDYLHGLRAVIGHTRAAFGWDNADARGASTITMQMVRNCLELDQAPTFSRKVWEVAYAVAAERELDKEQILSCYLTNAYFGTTSDRRVIRGARAASLQLFGKPLEELALQEHAVLAGMLRAPNYYMRRWKAGDYGPLQRRRDWVLDRLGQIWPSDYAAVVNSAKAQRVGGLRPLSTETGAPYFVDWVRGSTAEIALAETRAIYTTLDRELQLAAEEAIAAYAPQLRSAGADVEVALVAMRAETGEVLAMAGGTSYIKSQFNRATAKRSPGSTYKPFTFVAGLETGTHDGAPLTAATVMDPGSHPVDGFRPKSHVGHVGRLRQLLATSANGAPPAIAFDTGIARIQHLIRSAVMSDPSADGMMTIGGGRGAEASPLQIASAYSIFPNNGVVSRPRGIDREWVAGVLRTTAQETSRVVSAPAAAVTTQMMRSVIGDGLDGAWGTARAARTMAGLPLRIELAGKTGTGQVADLWFVGFSRSLVVVVWVGTDRNRPLPLDEG